MYDADWLDAEPRAALLNAPPSSLKDGKNIFANSADNSFGLNVIYNPNPSFAWLSAKMSRTVATCAIDFTPRNDDVPQGDTVCLFGLALMGVRYTPSSGGDKVRYTLPAHRNPRLFASVYRNKSTSDSQRVGRVGTPGQPNYQSGEQEVVLRPQTYNFKRKSFSFDVTTWWGNAAFLSTDTDIDGSFRVVIRVSKTYDSALGESDEWVLRIGRVMHGTRFVPARPHEARWRTTWSEATDPFALPGTFSLRRRRWPYRVVDLEYRIVRDAQLTEFENMYRRIGSKFPLAVMPDGNDPETLMYASIPPRGFSNEQYIRYNDGDSRNIVRTRFEELVMDEPETEG